MANPSTGSGEKQGKFFHPKIILLTLIMFFFLVGLFSAYQSKAAVTCDPNFRTGCEDYCREEWCPQIGWIFCSPLPSTPGGLYPGGIDCDASNGGEVHDFINVALGFHDTIIDCIRSYPHSITLYCQSDPVAIPGDVVFASVKQTNSATLWIKTIGTGTWIPIGTYPVEPTLYNYVIIRNVNSRTFPLITTSCWRDTNGYYQITATFNTTQGPTYIVQNDWTVRIPPDTAIQRPDCEK